MLEGEGNLGLGWSMGTFEGSRGEGKGSRGIRYISAWSRRNGNAVLNYSPGRI